MIKNILIFSTVYLPMIGGAELAIKEITSRLPNFKFILITSRMNKKLPKTEKIGNVLVYRLGFGCYLDKFFLPILGFLKARSILRMSDIHIFWAVMASYGGIAGYFLKKFQPQIPFLLTLQEGDYIPQKKFGLAGLFFRKIVKKADYIQVISNYLKELAVGAGAKCPIEIVPNGVDLKKIQNLKFKNKLNIKENEKIIITISRLVEKNAVDVIIDAFNILKTKQNFKNIKLLIAGDGYLKSNLKSQIANYKLQNDVLFLGTLSLDKVFEYLLISDIFIRPSRSEGLGTAFLEAMACGLPVIGTPVGGIPDFLKDRETGLFTKVDNPENLALKIKELLENDNLRKTIVENGKKLIEQNYSWDNIALKMQDIFEKKLR